MVCRFYPMSWHLVLLSSWFVLLTVAYSFISFREHFRKSFDNNRAFSNSSRTHSKSHKSFLEPPPWGKIGISLLWWHCTGTSLQPLRIVFLLLSNHPFCSILEPSWLNSKAFLLNYCIFTLGNNLILDTWSRGILFSFCLFLLFWHTAQMRILQRRLLVQTYGNKQREAEQ